MPKREPTPPLEDDYKYLAVSYPFPLHADVKINADSQDLAHWIASCIGKDFLTAIYHKPSAPNMVIIEVIKTCPRINALLGAHKWREFLRRPEPDQVDNESRIYYCRYSSGREVQKYGWKRLDVWDDWFNSFDPINGPFVCNPYPKTTFCEVPPETQTDYRLCRPLPTDLFPRPKPNAKPSIVPGSGKYVNVKEAGSHPIAAPAPVKQPTKSWASVISSDSASRRTAVDVSRTTSQTSSDDSASVKSPIDGDGDGDSALGAPPPGLGPPPGLPAPSPNLSQISSVSIISSAVSGWEFEPSSSPSRTAASAVVATSWAGEHGEPSVEIITSGFAAASIEDADQQKVYNGSFFNDKGGECQKEKEKRNKEKYDDDDDEDDDEDDVDYWAEQLAHPRDWDKPICPVHLTSCRSGICEVMDKIEREKKKKKRAEAGLKKMGGSGAGVGVGVGAGRDENENGNWRSEDGWAKVKVKGRGRGTGRGQDRGGRTRGRGRGNGVRGGRGGGGWV